MSELSDSIKFANLLCSRLCHDLISPAGAVNSAVELMEDEADGIDAQVLGLMSRSAHESTAKLAFFRTAYGDGGGMNAEITCEQLRALSSGIIPSGKVNLQWNADNIESLSNHAGKLLLMFVVIAVEALPRGGGINVRIHALEDGMGIACVAEGPGASLKESVTSALTGNTNLDQISARDINAFYAHMLASSSNATIETSSDEGAIMLAGLLP